MTTIILSIFILLDLLYYIIIFHIILSWLTLFWILIRIKFIDDLILPIYKNVKKIIPTNIWPFDFTPIIIIFIILFLKWLIMMFFPEFSNNALNILK